MPWSLREYGVALAGPDPKRLVDPVSHEQLRDELLAAIEDDWAPWARESQTRLETPDGPRQAMSRWKQTLVVLSFCRMLHTLTIGAVTSERAAGEWALGALDAEWSELIQRALDDRPDP